jgi:hypothetical protein
MLCGLLLGPGDMMCEGRAVSAAYLRNALWCTQNASRRSSEPGLVRRRKLISKPRTASAGELRKGSLFACKAGVEKWFANGVLLRV